MLPTHRPQSPGPLPVVFAALFLGSGIATFFTLSYQNNPFIKRRQFVFVSRRIEKFMGSMLAENYRGSLKKNQSQENLNQIETKDFLANLISHLISQYKEYNPLDWKINLMISDEVNACAISGGHIFVNTGLLKYCKSVDELAFVLGHEISHVEARHSAERLSLLLPFFFAAMGVAYYISQDYDYLVNMGFQYLIALPQSRYHEYEADKISVEICKKAGFDPVKGAEFFKRGKHSSLEMISTHPLDENRWNKILEEVFIAKKFF